MYLTYVLRRRSDTSLHVCMQGVPVRAGFDRGGEAKRRGAKARMAAMTTEEEEAKVVSGEAASDAAHSRPALDDTR